jgi:hypothetical protein
VGPRASLDGCEKLHLYRDSIPGPSSPVPFHTPTLVVKTISVSPTRCCCNDPWRGDVRINGLACCLCSKAIKQLTAAAVSCSDHLVALG